MSGHSKWSQIKRQKGVSDQRRGNLFTKLANAITLAAKHGGGNPEMNFRLRMTIDKARSSNMPNDNIDRAIKRGTGELEGESIEEVTYEAYGPNGVAIVIEAATDNKNRTANTIRSTLAKYGGKLGSTGSVLWMFNQRGIIRVAKKAVPDRETFELAVIDAGAEDFSEDEDGFTITTKVEELPAIKQKLEQGGFAAESAEAELIPQNMVAIEEQKVRDRISGLLEELEENDDVGNCSTNASL
ncbi:MAG: YebC/PmpR family DNA-binding transcriptional regulator [Patescibacteria group bacterium]